LKVISIFGGPRKKGNTATVLGWVEDELKSLGHDIDRVNVTDYKVGGCLGYHRCQELPNEPGCVQKDDAPAIFERVMAADATLFASPLFVWSLAGQVKPLVDRMFCLVTGYGTPQHKSLIGGKKIALVITCGGPKEGNADLVVDVFKRLSDYGAMTPAAELVVPFCTTPDQLAEGVKPEAKVLARQLTR